MRGRGNVAKRVLLQAAAFNLALILRSVTKAGTPKGLADLKTKLFCALLRILAALSPLCAPIMGPKEIPLASPYPFAKLRSTSLKLSHCRKVGF